MGNPAIFRVIDGRLDPWEPRAHPEPWERKLTRRERRRLARSGGRRRAVSVPASVMHPADRLRDVYHHVRWASPMTMTVEYVPLKSHVFRVDVTHRCPFRGHGRSCSERCWTRLEHVEPVESIVYCEGDVVPYQREVEVVLMQRAREVVANARRYW